MHTVAHQIAAQDFILSGLRTIYWPAQKALILSDLHLGKTTHFRKAGIAVPHHMFIEDLQRLWYNIQFFKPDQLIIVGDMFHSKANNENDLFLKWRNDCKNLNFKLVMGNHDILHQTWYNEAGIETYEQQLMMDNIAFVHDIQDMNTAYYYISGHIHPGVAIGGVGRQNLRFPCFHFTPTYCTLPAFGKFTGLATIKPNKKDKIFAVVEDEVVRL